MAAKKSAPKSAAASDGKNGDVAGRIFVGKSVQPEYLTLKLANRHGLVTGATGTGKTVTLQVLAEGLSRAGVSVFAADIKGDLSGISEPGEKKDFILERAKEVGIDYQPDQFSTIFWDLFGEQGHPIRATVSEMGPLLLSRIMDLNDTQEGVLNIVFRVADEQGLLLLDLKDLQSLLVYVADNSAELTTKYGNVSAATIGTIQRALLVLENQGAAKFFGEPALDIQDLIKTDRSGRGYVNILAADRLMNSPRLYAVFLLWLLSEMFEQLPEVGDPDQPKLVFFFDEAHLLFNEAPKALLEKIEQVVRLIRSKGVGVYFVTQNPIDVPDTVLAQLGNRVQHALRAYTPAEQKGVKAAAQAFRTNPKIDTERAIGELGKGEALVSFLEGNGVPEMVQRTLIRPPSGRIGPVTPAERKAAISASPIRGKYDTPVDRESAYEVLQKKAAAPSPAAQDSQASGGVGGMIGGVLGGIFGRSSPRRMSTGEVIVKQAARTITTQVTRSLINAVLGKKSGRASLIDVAGQQFTRSFSGRFGTLAGGELVRGIMGTLKRPEDSS